MRHRPLRPGLLLPGLLLPLVACGATPGPPAPGSAAPGSGSPGAAAGCAYPAQGGAARPVEPPPTGGVPRSGRARFVLRTGEGDVTVTMDRSRAPCTVNSFASLARQGYFDGVRCHRLVEVGIFVLQCGDPTGTGTGGPGYVFADETDGTESYRAGVVAMANAGPGTNGSQFFLVYDDSTALDRRPDYTIFGRMDEASRAVVARIAAEGHDGAYGDSGRPNNPAEIVSVRSR